MTDNQIIDVDSENSVSKYVDMVFSIANNLRGPYKSDRYKEIIIPMIIIRRLECALETKDDNGKTRKSKVIEQFKNDENTPPKILENLAGYPFYNTADFTLASLLDEADSIVENFHFYIDSFSPNIKNILVGSLHFKEKITELDKNNRLLGVVKKFSDLDLNPETIDGHKMGYMFEEIIRRFSENAEAGDHYTPREVIRALANILLAEGCDDVFNEGREITVLDMACGTGGMLSTTHEFIKRMNPSAIIRLFGQENNPESYAICLADMLIKGQEANNIRFADTMKEDCFKDTSMRFVIANPPFGLAWGGKDAGDGVERSVKEEAARGNDGRFCAGLPATTDMQLLFMQHAIAKMDRKNGRAAIITNGSPLFSGNTTSGESQIRKFMIENDLIETIIALPSQLFYNTDIAIYTFILSKNKREERKNKIQLINAVDMWEPLKRSLGKKRREISSEQIEFIKKIYSSFAECSETLYSHKRKTNCKIDCKIFDSAEFLYREWNVYQPLQRRGAINDKFIDKLKHSDYFTANSSIYNEAEFEELQSEFPRTPKDEKKYQKYILGKNFVDDVLAELEKNKSDKVYLDFSKFKAAIKKIISGVDGYSNSRLEKIIFEMSVIDKSAVVQKDSSGHIIPDPTTKDTEIIKLNQDVQEYFEREVLPHIPDAIWFNDEEKIGAEFPFTRYFYEYQRPEPSNKLFEKFMQIESDIVQKISNLTEDYND